MIDPISRRSAREAAREELSKAAYHRDDPTLLVRLLRWVGHLIETLLERSAAGAPGGGVGLVLLLGLLIAVVVAVRLRVGPLARTPPAPLLPVGGPRSAEEHRAAAAAAAAAGRYDEAVRERLRAVARDLETRGVLSIRPGRTADELAAEAAAALPELAAQLRAGVTAFDEICYGGRPATAADAERLAGLDDAVRRRRPTVPA